MFDYNNPYQPRQNFNNQYAYVNGIEGAKAYLMNPNQTILLMDSDQPIFYLKTSNGLGQASIRIFEFKEVLQSSNNNQSYALKSDIEAIMRRLEALEGVDINESNKKQ